MKRIRNFIEGVRASIDVWPEAQYMGLDGGGFAADARSLRSDSKSVSKDISKTAKGAKQHYVELQKRDTEKQKS